MLKNRIIEISLLFGVLCTMVTTKAFAAGTETTAVTGAFTTLTDDLIAIITPVGIAVVGLLAIIYGFRFARRLFGIIAR